MLHPVTGKAELCMPCALSALTGKSSDTWKRETCFAEEAPETLKNISELLIRAGAFRSLRRCDFSGQKLAGFEEQGRWALVMYGMPSHGVPGEFRKMVPVKLPNGTLEPMQFKDFWHIAAVEVRGKDRKLVDNSNKKPIPFDELFGKVPDYRKMLLICGYCEAG